MEKKEKIKLVDEFNTLGNNLKIILISGEEGVGKTFILNKFCNEIKNNALCYYARIIEKPEFITSSVMNDLLNFLKKEIPSARFGFVEIFGNKIAQDEGNLLSILSLISPIKKVVMLFDDLDNCNSNFLDFLLYLARTLKNSRIMIVATYNPFKTNYKFREFLIELEEFNETSLKKMHIESLTLDETFKFIDELGYRIPGYIKTRIFEASKGNPRSIELILLKLKNDKLIDDDKYWVGTFAKLPDITLPSYKQYFYSIYSALNDFEKRIITSAAVIGLRFSIDELKYLETVNENEIINVLEKLIKNGIISDLDDKNFEFERKEFQSILYNEEILHLRKRFLHKRLAEYYEKTCSCPDRIGLNYYSAEEYDKAETHLRNATNIAIANNDFKTALNYFEKVFKITQKRDARDLILAGDCYFHLGDFKKAIKFYDSAISVLESDNTNKEPYLSEAMIKKADSYATLGEYKEAKKILKMVEDHVDKNNKILMFHINKIYGYIARREFLVDESEKYYLSALELCKEINDDRYYALINKELGNVHYYKGEFALASEFFKKSIVYYEKLKDYDGLARCYNNLALIEINNNFNNVLEMYNSALNYADLSGNIYLVTLIHSNLGQIYFWSGKIKDAEKEIIVSEKLSEIQEEFNIRYDIFAFVADFKTMKGDFFDALTYLDHAIEITKEKGSEFYKSLYEIKKLEVSAIMGKQINEEDINNALESIRNVSTEISLLYVLPYVGLAYLYSGRYDKALDVFQRCYNEGKEKLQFLNLIVSLGNLPMVYLLLKNKEMFIEYYKILKNRSEMLNIDTLYLHVYNPAYEYIQKIDQSFNNEEKFFTENGLFNLLLKMYISYYAVNPIKEIKDKITNVAQRLGISVENILSGLS